MSSSNRNDKPNYPALDDMHANHPLYCLLFGDESRASEEKFGSNYDSFAEGEPLIQRPVKPQVRQPQTQPNLFKRAPKISPNNSNNALECLLRSFLEKNNLLDDLNYVIANLQPKTFNWRGGFSDLYDQFIDMHTDGSWPFGMEPVRLYWVLDRFNYPIRYFQHPSMREELLTELNKTAKFLSPIHDFTDIECQKLIDFKKGDWYVELQKSFKTYIAFLDSDISDKKTIHEAWPFGCAPYELSKFLSRITQLTTFLVEKNFSISRIETFTDMEPFPDYTLRESLVARLKMLDLQLTPYLSVAITQQNHVDATIDALSSYRVRK